MVGVERTSQLLYRQKFFALVEKLNLSHNLDRSKAEVPKL